MAPPLPRRRSPVAVAGGAVLAAAALLSACGGSGASGAAVATTATQAAPTTPAPAPPASTTPAPTTAPTTAAPTTTPAPTTTTPRPPDPLATPDAASGALIQAWEGGDRAAAARVGTAAAVRVLFAHPYGGEVLNDRGCGAPGPNPVVCTWGPYALASPTNPVYNLTALPAGTAWYVSSVVEET